MASGATEGLSRAEQVQEFVMHHVQDAPNWHIGPIEIPLPEFLTVHLLMAIIGTSFLTWLFGSYYRKRISTEKAPSGFHNALETLVLFVRDEISIAYLGEKDGKRLAPLMLSFFFLILTFNLMGIIPVFSTVTSNLSATAALAVLTFVVMTFGTVLKNGPKAFFSAFMPHGIPFPINILIFFLEFLGVFIKAGVLALRLFANLLAGHIALFSVLGLLLTYGAVAFPVIFLGLFVYMLEILVAFLQAYIFTMLSALFIGQVFHPEH